MLKKNKITLLIKSILDKLFALLGLIITSPVFFYVTIRLKLIGEDVFYLQRRVGYRGRDFFTYKFTTMSKGSEKMGFITTMKDNRPFKFGKFMRKTKINELPQLINILKGEMSLIGPRPLIRTQISEALSETEIEVFYAMRPGITGAGSLYFHHEDALLAYVEEPHQYYRDIIMPKKFELEKEYIRNWNLLLDIKIFILTILIVFKPGIIDYSDD